MTEKRGTCTDYLSITGVDVEIRVRDMGVSEAL